LATRWLLTGSLLPALLIVLGASDLLSLFAIDDGGATSALVILALAHALFGAFSASENVLVMTGHTALNAGLSAAVAVGNIVLGVLLIPRTGMTGAALATLLIYGAVVLARVGFSARFVGVHPLEWSLLFPTALAGALGALGYAVLRSVEPALLGRFVVYTVVFGLYAGSLLFFRRTVESRVAEISR